jgi:hypothetical protein
MINVSEIISSLCRRLGFMNCLKLIKICKVSSHCFSLMYFLNKFHQEFVALLGHNSIVTFKGNTWRVFINDVRKSTPCSKTGTTDRLSDLKESIIACLCKDRFHSRSKMMEFIKEIELFYFDVLKKLFILTENISMGKSHTKCSC